MSLTRKIGLFIAAAILLPSTIAVQAGGKAGSHWSGNVGVYSQYILRGITNSPEDNSAALQGSVDWAQGDTGFVAGVWGSSLGYSDPGKADGFEFDLYGGYKGKIGGFDWSLGLIQYLYANIDDADVIEITGSLGYGPVTFGFQTLTDDVVWGNSGDTYWTLAYSTSLPRHWELNVKAGYYTYETNGDFVTTSASGGDSFRHVDITFAHPLGKTGAKVHFTGVIGGDDRNGVSQDNAFVVGISYDFNL